MVKSDDPTSRKSAFEGDAKLANLAQMIASDLLHPDALSVAGIGSVDAAVLHAYFKSEDKKKEADEFIRELLRLDAFLRRIDARIAEIAERIARLEVVHRETAEKAQEAYERSFEAEVLLEEIQDGIDEAEWARIVSLLGEDARNAPLDKLIGLLNTEKEHAENEGNQFSSEAEKIAEQIEEERRNLDEALSMREEYMQGSPEVRRQLEQQFDDGATPPSKEQALTVEPDFMVNLP